MKFTTITLALALLVSFIGTAHAHHSFAIYELENKTDIVGVISRVTYTQPHIKIYVDVENEDGSSDEWIVETMNPNRWVTFDFPDPREALDVGENVTIKGWKARNGKPEMALGTFITEVDGEVEIRDEILQGERQGNRGGGGGMGGGGGGR